MSKSIWKPFYGWIVIAILILGFTLYLYNHNDNSSIAKDDLPPLVGTEVLQNVYDDCEDTVYIKVDRPTWGGGEQDTALADVTKKKKEWKRQYPTKKIVAMSVVTSDDTQGGHSMVVGLLIYYEHY